jgi:hypothetical protein
MLVIVGAVLVVMGLVFSLGTGLRPGRLPGDVTISRAGLRVYIPLGTCLLLSLVVTVVLRLLSPR